MYKKVNQKGFTLIELLIVIVIIGILSGVLISVIDPVRQQNRSKNASIKAGLNKASFAINTSRAGIGLLPNNEELGNELENITPIAGVCDDTIDELNCVFSIAGTVLPETCNGNYSGTGADQCYFYAIAPSTPSSLFRVIAKRYKMDPGDISEQDLIYVFDSSKGFYECDAGFDAATPSPPSTFVNQMEAAVTSGDCWVMQ